MGKYEARLGLEIIGYIITGCFFISHAPTMIRTIKNRSVGGTTPLPYLATLGSCMVWFFYGLSFRHPSGIPILVTNGIGIILMVVFIVIHFGFCHEPKQRIHIFVVLVVEVVMLAILATTTLTLIELPGLRRAVLVLACATCNAAVYVSLIPTLIKVVRTKNVEHMSLLVAFAMFANAIVWTTFTLLPLDLLLFVSYSLCTILGLGQLIVYAVYRSSQATD